MARPRTPEQHDPRYLFVAEKVAIPTIAERLKGRPGCSARTLYRRCAREGWQAQRLAHDGEIAAKAVGRLDSGGRADGTGGSVPGPPPESPARTATAPTAGAGSWEDAVDRAIAQAAEEMAEGYAKDLVEMATGRQDAIAAAKLAIGEARLWLVASQSRMEVTKGEDGQLTATVRTRKVKFAQRMAATAMLAQAAGVLRSMMTVDPIVQARRDLLSMRELEGRVAYLEMRVEGTLPPEKVQHEFEAQFDAQLKRLEQRLPPEDFARVLDALESDCEGQDDPKVH